MRYAWTESPVGPILLARDEAGVRVIAFGEGRRTRRKPRRPLPDWRRDDSSLAEEIAELRAYFAGELKRFQMPLAPEGTSFQRTVWSALLEIGYGETVSYGDIARCIGRPDAPRAVGTANGANPIAIVIPCHRVIGRDGSLTGYGGGIDNKRLLLALEREHAAPAKRDTQLGLALDGPV